MGEHIGKLEAGNWAIVNISKVGQQVVGGMKYYYYGTFGDKHENKIYAATITLYTRPWDDYFEGKVVKIGLFIENINQRINGNVGFFTRFFSFMAS